MLGVQEWIAANYWWIVAGGVVLGLAFGPAFVIFVSSKVIETTLLNVVLGGAVGVSVGAVLGLAVAELGGGSGPGQTVNGEDARDRRVVRLVLKGEQMPGGAWSFSLAAKDAEGGATIVASKTGRADPENRLSAARGTLLEYVKSADAKDVQLLELDMPDASWAAQEAVMDYAEELGMRRVR